MPKLTVPPISPAILVLLVISFTVAARYPGVINLKLLGAEILIDGRSIEIPKSK
jgi:hypothetical protein